MAQRARCAPPAGHCLSLLRLRQMALPTKQHGGNVSHLLPSELVDKCVGSRIWVRSRPAHLP